MRKSRTIKQFWLFLFLLIDHSVTTPAHFDAAQRMCEMQTPRVLDVAAVLAVGVNACTYGRNVLRCRIETIGTEPGPFI